MGGGSAGGSVFGTLGETVTAFAAFQANLFAHLYHFAHVHVSALLRVEAGLVRGGFVDTGRGRVLSRVEPFLVVCVTSHENE